MSPDSAEDTVEYPLVKGPYDQEESKMESITLESSFSTRSARGVPGLTSSSFSLLISF